jgi:hypothetical protein
MKLINVVIPNWNGLEWLKVCLPALRRQTFSDFEVTIVDNGSIDGTVEWIQSHFRHIHLISNRENLGFARAVNQGIRRDRNPYAVTLNNDTKPDPDWLYHLFKAAESWDRAGMVASKMLFSDDPTVINSAGVAVDRAGLAWDRLGGQKDNRTEVTPYEVFGACAGAALYRRRMLDEIGFFDEDFFAYLEDVDLAWRAQQSGWRCLYAPRARVLHHHSGTSREGSSFKSYHLGRNKIWLLIKNYPFRSLWYYVPLVVLYDLVSVAVAIVLRKDVSALRGRLAALIQWRKMWSKRLRLAVSTSHAISLMQPVLWPWKIYQRYKHIEQFG